MTFPREPFIFPEMDGSQEGAHLESSVVRLTTRGLSGPTEPTGLDPQSPRGLDPGCGRGPWSRAAHSPRGPQQPSAKASVLSLGPCLGLGWEWGTSL